VLYIVESLLKAVTYPCPGFSNGSPGIVKVTTLSRIAIPFLRTIYSSSIVDLPHISPNLTLEARKDYVMCECLNCAKVFQPKGKSAGYYCSERCRLLYCRKHRLNRQGGIDRILKPKVVE
jgi:hypothetical protein